MAEIRIVSAYVDVPYGEAASRRGAAPEASALRPVTGLEGLSPAEADLYSSGPLGTPALDHVSLVVHDGETVVVIGPSGCGKTTLLRSVAGLQKLQGGTVFMDERDVTDARPGDRGIGMVFQSYALYPHMMARGNLAFFFHVRHREAEVNERIKEVSQVLGFDFEDLLDRRPKQLSGGQQQRVAIGRCIIRDPSVFLFDEPLSNLDARLRQSTRVEIKRLLRRFAISAMYVTHDQTEALALADRIAVMRRGRIEQVGTARQLHDHPETLFVATFLNSTACNVLQGYVHSGAVRFGSVLLEGVPAARFHSGHVLAGLRAEDIRIGPAGCAASLPGEVVEVRMLPSERRQHARVRSSGRIIMADVDRDVPVQVGDSVGLQFDAARLLLFDPTDGRRLSAG